MVRGLEADLPDLQTKIVVRLEGDGAVPDGWFDFQHILDREPGGSIEGRAIPAAAVSELIFTSGTEAAPKAIMHTEQTANFAVRASWRSLSMTSEDVVWMPSPIGHSTGFNFGVRMAVYHGLKLVLQDRWDPTEAAKLVQAERCTYTLAATTFLRDLVEAADRGAGDISTMSMFGCGGAPVPPDLVRAASRHGVNVLRLYGSTEALVATWNRRSSPESARIETDGCALDGVEVEVWSEDGQPGVGVPGEIMVRGPETCVGFFADPQRTAATFHPEGWVRSGDLGVMDEAGYLTVVGRKKEIIIRGGLNIAPREVEDLVTQMPGIRAAVLVGLPHERLGEIGCICVVLEDGAEVTLEDVRRHLEASGMAGYKHPEQLVRVDAMPTTPTGKIQKFQLVDQILSQQGGAA
jgi:acyl-CoA synthetase (AMP-forming)/AMP-acid ligase II